jgi:hypothetical protein
MSCDFPLQEIYKPRSPVFISFNSVRDLADRQQFNLVCLPLYFAFSATGGSGELP